MEEYIGIVKLFAGNFAPRGWMLCEGQLLSVHRHPDLFSLIDYTYGGDGMDKFALPDLRSRAVIGATHGSVPERTGFKPGDNGGLEKMSLNATHLPDHTHTAKVMVSTTNAADALPKRTSVLGAPGRGTGRSFEPSFGFIDIAPDMQLADSTVTIDSTTGGGQEFPLRNPYMAMNYIICVDGLYPSRP